ncbi:MAG: hypothetical protein JXR46_13435 [Calditrichaceae bacterium]|nr:hypothetical protein [Calditrichaceae bacterium]MBN2710038.1 hypothetical protein [Calditrichaceae bacterium]RQV92138.1 MAG: hypothetical protein EH224_16480 [Calditrichota bacterium]
MEQNLVLEFQQFIIYVNFSGTCQAFLTVSVTSEHFNSGRDVFQIYQNILHILNKYDLQIVHERLFGSNTEREKILSVRSKVISSAGINDEVPVTFIQGQPVWGQGLAGIQIQALKLKNSEDKIWIVKENDKACGRGWKYDGQYFILLQNIYGNQNSPGEFDNRKYQTAEMFERAQRIINSYGGSFRNVVRTWIYLNNILDWYDDFNTIRNEKFKEFRLLANSPNGKLAEEIYLPSSTGIEGDNPVGASAVMDLLAVVPNGGGAPKIFQTTGVKQKSPYRYNSAFSRAMTLDFKDMKQVLISGTAAIDENGKSLHPGDARSQVKKTLEVVEYLVADTGASLHDICGATLFLKQAGDYPVYLEVLKERNLSKLPAVCMVADVCRDELLVELDAIISIDK